MMQYGICLLSLIPGRREPSGTSEMVTQLLFGEHYTVIETTENWIKVTTAHDGYECWLSITQHNRISESTFNKLQTQKPIFCAELIQIVHNKTNDQSYPITIGAALPLISNGKMSFDSLVFSYEGQLTKTEIKGNQQDIINSAYLFMNSPYLWGGRSPFGIDCSGFTQTVFKLNGYKLPRDAYQQVELGDALSFVEEAEAGDLAFFDNEEGKIIHVGILLDNERIIHASGRVKIDKFDHYGIFNTETRKYSYTLRVIKRLLI